MNFRYYIIRFSLLLGVIIISLVSCINSTKDKQANKEMNIGGFIFKVPDGFKVTSTNATLNGGESYLWESDDSISFTFNLQIKGNGIISPKDLYDEHQLSALRGGCGFIDNDKPIQKDNMIFALGKELGGEDSPTTNFIMALDFPNSPNIVLIESCFNDKNLYRINEIIQNYFQTYTYKVKIPNDN